MGEELTPILVGTRMLLDAHIVIKAMITNVYVNEQPMMVKNDNVFHCINFFLPIEPCTMCLIMLGLANFNQ
jgi:hypothetical protein